MLAVTEGGGEAGAGAVVLKLADKLAAVIRLPDEVAEFNAATRQVSLNAGGEAGAGGCGAAGSEGQELQTAAYFAGGVRNSGQIEGLGLRPIMRDVIQVLGIGRDLLKEAPGGLEGGQVLLALVLLAAALNQAVSVPDTFQSAVTPGEIKLTDQAARAEGGQLAAQFDDALFHLDRRPMGLMKGSARMLPQAF